jgi:hypothetical protein
VRLPILAFTASSLVFTASGLAQTARPPVESTPGQVPDQTRRLVDGFQTSLRGAIESAAGQLTKRVREAIPQTPIDLQFQTDPLVSGVVLPDGTPVFHVLIPAIQDVQQKLIPLMVPRQQRPPDATRVGIIDPPLTDPNAEYTAFTHSALIDAVLDQGPFVPVPAGKYLTVIAGELIINPTPFTPRSRFLMLQIKGEDLLALKQNFLSRDDARAKIIESRY